MLPPMRSASCAVGGPAQAPFAYPLALLLSPPLQVEMRVLVNSGGFDEGAEAQEFEHWLE